MNEIADFQDLGVPERLALSYATAATKARFAAFLMLDAQLREVAMVPREAMLTQVRLAWWREALASVAALGANAHPVLRSAAAAFGGERVRLAALADGWEAVSVGEDQGEGVVALAKARAAICKVIEPSASAGAVRANCEVWSRFSASLLRIRPTPDGEDHSREPLPPLPRTLRPLAVICGLARRSLAHGDGQLLGDRLSPIVAIRLGILGR